MIRISCIFAHEYYRDYFAARHILNAIEACRCVYHHIPKDSSVFWDFGLSGIWFDIYNNKEPYRLIGEICGDCKNVTDPRYCLHRTALDDLLDLCYRFTVVRGMENLINTMYFSRNGVLRYVSFTGQNFPILPTFCRYEKCNFSDSRIIYVPLFDKDNYFYAVHGDIMVIVFCEYTDAAVWDMRRNTLIGDYNFFDYSDKISEFYYAEFSENGCEISLFSDISVLRFDVYTGEVKEQINGFDEVENESWYKRYLSSYNKQSDLDSIFLEQVIASLHRFKDCDFTGVDMPDKNDLLMLEKMNDGHE